MTAGILVKNDGKAVLLVHKAEGVDFVSVGEQGNKRACTQTRMGRADGNQLVKEGYRSVA